VSLRHKYRVPHHNIQEAANAERFLFYFFKKNLKENCSFKRTVGTKHITFNCCLEDCSLRRLQYRSTDSVHYRRRMHGSLT